MLHAQRNAAFRDESVPAPLSPAETRDRIEAYAERWPLTLDTQLQLVEDEPESLSIPTSSGSAPAFALAFWASAELLHTLAMAMEA